MRVLMNKRSPFRPMIAGIIFMIFPAFITVNNFVDSDFSCHLCSFTEADAQATINSHPELTQKVEVKPVRPKKPLCNTCRKVVQKAGMIDIEFESATNATTLMRHLHQGALDENGKVGFVHDAKVLHKQPLEATWDNETIQNECQHRDNNYKVLVTHVELPPKEHDPKSRIFCMIYTIKDDNNHSRIRNIAETWGRKCDGFMAASNFTDASLGIVNLIHEGEETYDNMWIKAKSMWAYAYDNFYDDYDFFHIGGDDVFLIVENLRLFLDSEEIRTAQNGGTFLPLGNETKQTPLYIGERFKRNGRLDDIFNSGGPGYVLNKAALKSLVVHGFVKYQNDSAWSAEDVMVGRTLKELNILPYETRDKSGGERFSHFAPGHALGYKITTHRKHWYVRYSFNLKEGLPRLSRALISFHYIKDDMMKRMEALLYQCKT